MPLAKNPILPGFNPDPSIVRVGSDYYIATSTFEWYPGVQIHHSKDLANWTLVKRPLDRTALLDLRGVSDSAGVWAPCLTHDGARFWLVYTITKAQNGAFVDCHNYITNAASIEGPWTDPVYANSSGFDPSVFHDADGRKWFVNMLWDHRSRPNLFAGISLQEFDPSLGRLVGPRKNIYQGTKLGCIEGPHLYRRNGWYYILVAEGGTGWHHACTMARSRNLWGPYETHPQQHILTAKDTTFTALQKVGHGDIVDTPDGKTYLVHLTGRPVGHDRRCVLGRETAIQEAYWKDDWLYVKDGPLPSLHVELPGIQNQVRYWAEKYYTFDGELDPDFQWLRTPLPERIFQAGKAGKLTLVGRESIGSRFEQALVARRQSHLSYDAETSIDFQPEDERQYAGLTAYYGGANFFYLTVTANAEGQRELLLMTREKPTVRNWLDEPMVDPVPIPSSGKVRLALEVRGGTSLQFFYALCDGTSEELVKIGPVYDASVLSDEAVNDRGASAFTGAFVGVACSDLNGLAREAAFDYFVYRPIKDSSDRYDI